MPVPWSVRRDPTDELFDCLSIPSGEDLGSLPPEYQAMLTEHDRAAYADPGGTFASLATRCRLDGMRTWLETMAESDRCLLQLYHTEKLESEYTDVIFGGFVAGGMYVRTFACRAGRVHPAFQNPSTIFTNSSMATTRQVGWPAACPNCRSR